MALPRAQILLEELRRAGVGVLGLHALGLHGDLRCSRPDVVIATSPPLVAVIAGFVAAKVRWRPAPWVFEIRDLWPESAVTTGVLTATSPLTRALYALERWAARAADRINVLTPAFEEDLMARGLAPRESNFPNRDEAVTDLRRSTGAEVQLRDGACRRGDPGDECSAPRAGRPRASGHRGDDRPARALADALRGTTPDR
ncbi:MAG: hypothetical protein JW751_27260 [Polyangiaceae bacterium]|nr:hypothetical protein [Polyangiaceae bacterium]